MHDTHMIIAVFAVALYGGIIGLDRTAAGQFMISQPIVAGPLTGWLLGDPTSGIVIGATLELIWVLDLPIGTFVPADATISAVSATAIAALSGPGGAALPVIGLSVLLTTAMVPVTMKADGMIRHWNSRIIDATLASPDGHAVPRLGRTQFAGVGLFFLKSFVLYCLFIPLGLAAVGLIGYLPAGFHRALALFIRLLPLLGISIVVSKLSIKTWDLYFLIGFVTAAVFTQALHGSMLVVLLLAAAAGWMGARINERRA